MTISTTPPREMNPQGTMMSYLSFNGDEWGCMTQLFFDNTSTLLGVLAVLFNMTFFGVPIDIINEVQFRKTSIIRRRHVASSSRRNDITITLHMEIRATAVSTIITH